MTRKQWTWGFLKSAAIFAALCVVPTFVVAEDVTLTSKQGALALTGRVIGFDGTYLTIESPYGPLTLDYAQVACDGADCPDPENHTPTIRLSGASRMAEVLLPALIEGFARAQGQSVTLEQAGPRQLALTLSEGARFDIYSTTSAEGFADLISFQTDIAMSLREVRRTERALAEEVGIGQLDAPGQSQIIGLDGLVPVVSPRQSATALSLSDLSRAFAGDAVTWSDLGGGDVPVSLHLGPRGDGEVEYFLDRVVRRLGRAPADTITYHATLADMAAAVAADPGGLGIARYGRPTVARMATLVGRCGFKAVPHPTTIKSQDYPLTTPLFLYLPEWRLHPIARDFLTYLNSPDAQLIVRRSGFIDQQPQPVPLDAQGQRFVSAIAAAGEGTPLAELQRMVALMSGLDRQTISFRFEVGAVRLNATSRSSLLSLAQSVQDGAFDGTTLWLIGFSDGQGDAASNRRLSRDRAEAVRADLIAALGGTPDKVAIRTDGFGEALPMACDDTVWGRDTNRRVELWVGSQ